MASASIDQSPFPSLDRNSRVEGFLKRFSPAGQPSERAMVKAFIDNYVRENGQLPQGTHQLMVQTESFGFLGRFIDYGDLSSQV